LCDNLLYLLIIKKKKKKKKKIYIYIHIYIYIYKEYKINEINFGQYKIFSKFYIKYKIKIIPT